MYCTVRRRFSARAARVGAIRIAGAIDMVESSSGVRWLFGEWVCCDQRRLGGRKVNNPLSKHTLIVYE